MEREPCAFCGIEAGLITAENTSAVAIRDAFPVNPGHTLVIPRRHISSWFDTTAAERSEVFELVDWVRTQLDAEFQPAGYNIGINVGTAAGHLGGHANPATDGHLKTGHHG